MSDPSQTFTSRLEPLMTASAIIIFVGLIVSACIMGGAIFAGLDRIAKAISKT